MNKHTIRKSIQKTHTILKAQYEKQGATQTHNIKHTILKHYKTHNTQTHTKLNKHTIRNKSTILETPY